MAVTIKDPVNITGFAASAVSRILSGRGCADEENRSIIMQAVRNTCCEYYPVPTRRAVSIW